MDYHLIVPQLYVGSHPRGVDDIKLLKRQGGITTVLNLQTDDDMRHFGLDWDLFLSDYRDSKIDVRRVPVRDFDSDDLEIKLPICVATLNELIQSSHTVYLHCSAGAGRSPTVAIAYLFWRRDWDLDRALAHVTQCRPCSPCMEAIARATARVARPTPT
jgi:protein-tyrosine phosphatase